MPSLKFRQTGPLGWARPPEAGTHYTQVVPIAIGTSFAEKASASTNDFATPGRGIQRYTLGLII